jgi:hypothetical protein
LIGAPGVLIKTQPATSTRGKFYFDTSMTTVAESKPAAASTTTVAESKPAAASMTTVAESKPAAASMTTAESKPAAASIKPKRPQVNYRIDPD